MSSRVGHLVALMASAAIGLSACGSGDGESPAFRPSLIATPTAQSSPAAAKATDPCLLSVSQVKSALAGSWKVKTKSGDTCSYASNRGAIFAIQRVAAQDLQAHLDSARLSCATTPRQVAENSSFACVEKHDDGDVVVGNIIARQQVWLLLIVPDSSGKQHYSELKAMAALLARVPAD